MPNKTTRPNLYDVLKISAIILMVIDHLGYFLFPDIIILREIGRRAFPLFLMLIGLNQSSKISKQLWISAVIMQLFLWGLNFVGLTNGRGLNILIGIILVKLLMGYIGKWSDWILLLIFGMSIVIIPYSMEIVEYGSCVLASSIFAVLISRWIGNKSDHNSNISDNKWYISNIIKYMGITLISILMVYGFISVNSKFAFDSIGWFVAILGRMVSIGFIYKLCRDNFTIKSLVGKKIGNIIIWINNRAVYVYIIHVIFLYIITICWYYWFR